MMRSYLDKYSIFEQRNSSLDNTTGILNALSELNEPFYYRWDFWIAQLIGLLGLIASVKAFVEARKAKRAAFEAGRAVKIQTITIELTELIQRMDVLDVNMEYKTGRDLYNEINRRVRRITAPYVNEPKFKGAVEEVFLLLQAVKKGLDENRPINAESSKETGIPFYYAIEGHFSNLSGGLAALCGVFEQQNS